MVSSQAASGTPARSPLTPSLGQVQGLDIKAKYYSPRSGGDFFDALAVESRVVFLLTDIAGKWADTIAHASELQQSFRLCAAELLRGAGTNESEALVKLLQELNRSLLRGGRGVRYAPTFVGIYNLPLAILTFINAGAPPPVFADGDGLRMLESGGVPLGIFSHLTHEPAMQGFEPGATLLLVTKGVIESRRGTAEFGIERLQSVVWEHRGKAAGPLCEATLEEANAFRKRPWILSQPLPFLKPEAPEDLTAVALVRSDGGPKERGAA